MAQSRSPSCTDTELDPNPSAVRAEAPRAAHPPVEAIRIRCGMKYRDCRGCAALHAHDVNHHLPIGSGRDPTIENSVAARDEIGFGEPRLGMERALVEPFRQQPGHRRNRRRTHGRSGCPYRRTREDGTMGDGRAPPRRRTHRILRNHCPPARFAHHHPITLVGRAPPPARRPRRPRLATWKTSPC
jgi:hypothetical protein